MSGKLNPGRLGTGVIVLGLMLAASSPAARAQSYVWTERQPAGNVDEDRVSAAGSANATKLIVGVWGERLHKAAAHRLYRGRGATVAEIR